MTLRRSSSDTLPGTATAAFLEAAIVEGKRYEEAVAQDLSAVVFERVFPRLVTAIAAAAGEGRRPVGSPLRSADLPLSAAVPALRRGPRAAAGQRRALR